MPRNGEYLELFFKLKGKTEDQIKEVESKYKAELGASFRLKLDIEESSFVQLFREFYLSCQKSFNPALWKQIKYFCTSKVKKQWVLQCVKDIKEETLKQNPVDPTFQLFDLCYLGLAHYLNGEYQNSVECFNQAISHTPTYPDLYYYKAKPLKKLGKYEEMVEAAGKFRSLDKSDRCSTKFSVKFLLKDNRNKEADETFKYFMQNGDKNEENVHELCFYQYETKLAKSYLTELKFPRGLRLLKFCMNHIEEYKEDQNEFYTFCLRRLQLKSLYEIIVYNNSDFKNQELFNRSVYNYLANLILLKKYNQYELHCQKKGLVCGPVARDSDEKNVVENPLEVEKEMDLSGAEYLKNLNIDEEIDKYSTILINLSSKSARVSKAVKTQRVLFEIFLGKKKALVCMKLLSFLIENSKDFFSLNLMLKAFQKQFQADTSPLITGFMEQVNSKIKDTESLYKSEWLYQEQLGKELLDLIQTSKSQKEDMEVSEELHTWFLGKKERISQASFRLKSKLLSTYRKYVFEKDLYLDLLAIKKSNN